MSATIAESRRRASVLCILVTILAGATSLCAEPAATAATTAPATAGATASAPATAPATRPTYSADSPAQWLSGRGKSEAWLRATDRCRELLDKLDPADPRVASYVPNLRRQTEVLGRVDGFTWKTITAVEFLQNALEDLLAGKRPNVRYAGKQLAFPYWSDRMQRIEAVWMHVPPGYDPAGSYQLFMYYKSGGGIYYNKGKAAGGYEPTAEMANKTDTFHAWSSLNIQLKGRMGLNVELEEFPAALAREFAVSPDRVFLSGYSDGGFSDLWLAAQYPHLVAGIAPNVANWQYTNVEQVNLLNVPYLVVDGWGDAGYVQNNFLRFIAIANAGYDVSAIFGQHGHGYDAYKNEEEFRYILDWAKTKKRDLYPRHVRYATWNLNWNRAYWLTIDRAISPYLVACIDAQVKEANRVEVTASNVAAYSLRLGGGLVDPAKPVTVLTNGKGSYSGPYRQALSIEVSLRPHGRFIKDASMPDDITAQMEASTYDGAPVPGRQWLAVRGTAASQEALKLLSKWFPKDARADTAVTDEDIARLNLILYGGPEVNGITARIAADLPVAFGKTGFRIGRQVYDLPTHCVVFLHPNPLNPQKYVLVYAFNDSAAFTQHDGFGLTRNASPWQFRMGDAVVGGIPADRNSFGVATDDSPFRQRHIIFDPAWRPDAAEPLGELKRPFDRFQVLRLRADAIREAAGADVGIIWSETPQHVIWNASLPAGPVALADLATLDALPEYITVGEMSGQNLKKADPLAWSILADRHDPAYEPDSSLAVGDIDPAKTYRVAMGYHGMPAYGANPGKMPPLFKFASEEEFLANPNNSLPVRHMRQIPFEVTEAVARFIRKRGSVSPRPVRDDLEQYLMNPRDNQLDGYDWLHLAFDGNWKDLRGGQDSPYDYTLNIGLKTGPAPSGQGAKTFHELGVPAAKESSPVELPVSQALGAKATVQVRDLAVAEGHGDKIVLEGPGAEPADVIARGRLLIVRLTTSGQGDEAAGLAVLSPVAQMPVSPSTMRLPAKGDMHALALLGDGADPTRAVMLLDTDATAKAAPMVARGLGWNQGLIGLREEVTIERDAPAVVRVLVLALDPAKVAPLVERAAETSEADKGKPGVTRPAGKAPTATTQSAQAPASRVGQAARRSADELRKAQLAVLEQVTEAIYPELVKMTK